MIFFFFYQNFIKEAPFVHRKGTRGRKKQNTKNHLKVQQSKNTSKEEKRLTTPNSHPLKQQPRAFKTLKGAVVMFLPKNQHNQRGIARHTATWRVFPKPPIQLDSQCQVVAFWRIIDEI